MHLEPVKREVMDFSAGPPKDVLEQVKPPKPGIRAPMQNARLPGSEAKVVPLFDEGESAGYT